MKILITSIILAASLTNLAHAGSNNNYSISTANNSSCSQNESTGRTVEFGAELDTKTQNGKVFAKWVFQIGQENQAKIDCNRLFNNEVSMQELELEKARLELDLLKAQLAATRKAISEGKPAPVIPPAGSDW